MQKQGNRPLIPFDQLSIRLTLHGKVGICSRRYVPVHEENRKRSERRVMTRQPSTKSKIMTDDNQANLFRRVPHHLPALTLLPAHTDVEHMDGVAALYQDTFTLLLIYHERKERQVRRRMGGPKEEGREKVC